MNTNLKKMIQHSIQKELLFKSIKIALAALISIAIAGELGLKYSATAGIITVLSIQNTKKETLRSAMNRALAFACALILAAGAYTIMGFTISAFAVYLLLFALLCLNMGWAEAISMDSVLITHFLTEQNMASLTILNEVLLFIIGVGMGILVNLHLHRRQDEFERLAAEVDEQIKGILYRMSGWLLKEDKTGYRSDCFIRLEESLEAARLCAAANYNNRFRNTDSRELDYVAMRARQTVVLQGIYENIKSISYLPRQAEQVAKLLQAIEQEYHKDNTVESLLAELENLFYEMKKEDLPISREEFEARAILFYILKQLEKFLLLKREFIVTVER